MIPAAEIDRLLPANSDQHWRKVARVIARTMQALEGRGVQIDGGMADAIDARMKALVNSGQLEAEGDIRKWRYSEVRILLSPSYSTVFDRHACGAIDYAIARYSPALRKRDTK